MVQDDMEKTTITSGEIQITDVDAVLMDQQMATIQIQAQIAVFSDFSNL